MPSDPRPDPDDLLARLRDADTGPPRGRLRVYFGASAGVGKTFAMLLAARRQRDAGLDVLAGVVETHGRAETAALLDGLVVLPPKQLPHRERTVPEFDLDAALARRPGLLLVDELAHTNAPGSRHPKRWQDVEELLAAGIDVYGTLNVQHLESLNDVVGGITGIVVRETVPDTFFDRADEVVLVDTPADELIARLAAGKVYLPAQADRAAQHFFRKGNLMALRELALRRTADRVEGDVLAYRTDRDIAPVWKTEAALLCCIGPEDGAEHVVRSAARLAQQLAVAWHAVFVETPALRRRPPAAREAVMRTVRLAQTLGADTTVLAARGVAAELVAHARRHNLSKLVIGRAPPRSRWRRGSLRDAIAHEAPDIDVIDVGTSARPAPGIALPRPAFGPPAGYAGALAACAVATLVAWPLRPWFDLANIVMVFLLAVVGTAVRWGRGPAVCAAFVSVAAFDFVFVAPRWSLAVSDVQYLLTFAVMLVVGLVIGQLTAGLRFQATAAREREGRARALFELARDLSNVLTREPLTSLAAQAIQRGAFPAQVRLFVLGDDDRLQPPAEPADGLDLGTATWCLDQVQPAGLGTDTLPGSAWLYLPLAAPMRARGVLAVRPASPAALASPEQRRQLDTFATLVAMALERIHYVEVAQQATVQIESERLRNSLLSALSHDLRTPLAVLRGLAETLGASQPPLADAQAQLADTLRDESLRMQHMVENLLDMARLESGEVRLRLDWESVEELTGSALRAARVRLGDRPVSVTVPVDLPLVRCDAVLVERVLVNLLENAAKYTPAGTPVTIVAAATDDTLRLTVADTGPGVPPGLEATLFEKFTRGHGESAATGMGLGLAICRAIVAAHGGEIGYRANTPHGAAFTVTLPRGEPPAAPMETA